MFRHAGNVELPGGNIHEVVLFAVSWRQPWPGPVARSVVAAAARHVEAAAVVAAAAAPHKRARVDEPQGS